MTSRHESSESESTADYHPVTQLISKDTMDVQVRPKGLLEVKKTFSMVTIRTWAEEQKRLLKGYIPPLNYH